MRIGRSWLVPTLVALIVLVFAMPFLSTRIPAGSYFLVAVSWVLYRWVEVSIMNLSARRAAAPVRQRA